MVIHPLYQIMKTSIAIGLFLIVFLCFPKIGNSQQNSLDILGTETSFRITSNNTILSDEQVLIKRPTIIPSRYNSRYQEMEPRYTYDWYRLEFRTSEQILAIKHPKKNNILSVKFYRDGHMLADIVMHTSYLNKVLAEQEFEPSYYSLDLQKVPTLVLKEADAIDLLILK